MSKIIIGTNIIEDCINPIVISGVPLFSYKLESDIIKLSFQVNSPPANTTIKLVDNEKIQGDVDLTIDNKTATLKFGEKTLIEINLENETAHVNLDLRPIALHIYSDDKALYVGGSQLSGTVIKNCTNGIGIG